MQATNSAQTTVWSSLIPRSTPQSDEVIIDFPPDTSSSRSWPPCLTQWFYPTGAAQIRSLPDQRRNLACARQSPGTRQKFILRFRNLLALVTQRAYQRT